MQQAEEPAAEPEAKRHRGFRLVEERGVVQAELLERVAQLRVLMAFDGVQPGEHHRLQLLEARERLGRLPARLRDGVADLRVADFLDVRDEEADFAHAELADLDRLRGEDADLQRLVVLPFGHQPDLHPGSNRPVDHADDNDHAAVRVVPGVEDQGLERRGGRPSRRRQPRDDGLENLRDTGALLRAGEQRTCPVEPDDVRDLATGLFRLGAREIDLVDDRDDFEVVLDGEIGIGERLGLDALRGVHEQQRAFACREGPCDFVREVHVAGRVDQVEDVLLSGFRGVMEADRVGLDRDAPLTLQVHRVQHLRFHLAGLQGAGQFEKAVGQRRLAVVDVGDDGEVANMTRIHGPLCSTADRRARSAGGIPGRCTRRGAG